MIRYNNIYEEVKKLKEDKKNLIVQLVTMEELKDENKKLRENLEVITGNLCEKYKV